MKIVDRLLRRVGLMRASQCPVRSMSIDFATKLSPTVVDIELMSGHRVCGAIDPWWPGWSSSFTPVAPNPLFASAGVVLAPEEDA